MMIVRRRSLLQRNSATVYRRQDNNDGDISAADAANC